MFEVGKKYKYDTLDYCPPVIECIAVGIQKAMFRNTENNNEFIIMNDNPNFKEVKEPVVLTRYIPLLQGDDGKVFLSSINYTNKGYNYSGFKTIDWVEVQYIVKDNDHYQWR